MSKRRNEDDMDISDNEGTSQQNDQPLNETIDVNFEFFDPKQEDYGTIKNFMNALFGKDGPVNNGDLSDLIISQPLIGTTIKTAADEDAYSIFTILNMNVHRERESIFQLTNILLNGTKSNAELNQLLRNLLAEGSEHHLGYLVNERLINMPVQTAPPMYTMLQEEIQWALEDKEPYNFEYFFLLSKTYRETQLNPDLQEVRHGEGGKKQKAQPNAVEFYFNAEEELLQPLADFTHTLKFSQVSQNVPESKRAFNEFGIVEGRKLLVFHKNKYQEILKVLDQGIPKF